jgi:hypothetical protein
MLVHTIHIRAVSVLLLFAEVLIIVPGQKLDLALD